MNNRKKTLRESASLKFFAAIICSLSLAVGFFSATLCVICWQNNVFFENDHATFLSNVINEYADNVAMSFDSIVSGKLDDGTLKVTEADGRYYVDEAEMEKILGYDAFRNFGFMLTDENGNTVYSSAEGCDVSTGIPGYTAIDTGRTVHFHKETGKVLRSLSTYSGYENALSDAQDLYAVRLSENCAVSLYGGAVTPDGLTGFVLLASSPDGETDRDYNSSAYLNYWMARAGGAYGSAIPSNGVSGDYFLYENITSPNQSSDPASPHAPIASTRTDEAATTVHIDEEREPTVHIDEGQEPTVEFYWRQESDSAAYRLLDIEEMQSIFPDGEIETVCGLINSDNPYLPLVVIYDLPETEVEWLGLTSFIKNDPEEVDEIFFATNSTALIAKYAAFYPYILAACAVLFLISAFFLACSCGYRYPADGPKPFWFDRIPIELFIPVGIALVLATAECYTEMVYRLWMLAYYRTRIATIAYIAALPTATAVFATLTLMTLSVRLKTHMLLRSSIIGWVLIIAAKLLRLFWKLVSGIKLIWKIVLMMAGVTVFEGFVYLVTEGQGVYFPVTAVINIILTVILGFWAMGFAKIRERAHKIAQGEQNVPADREFMFGDLKKVAEDLDGVDEGVRLAVEERIRSERLKAELITNVSHDLKTPLTSIVNYIDILSKDEIQPEEAREHVEIIKRQSAKMKKLIEDLVEVSKASSGNISANLERTDVNLLLNQSVAEYSEKFERARLESVLTLPNRTLTAMLDGKLMWRVLDNLLNNICKYALENTRVYITLEEGDGQGIITFRNISQSRLNISPDELTERFVRGDASRNTDGSGLGLSIAKSLCEIQKVGFRVSIDGDLFKAGLTVPLCGDEEILSESEGMEDENESGGEENE